MSCVPSNGHSLVSVRSKVESVGDEKSLDTRLCGGNRAALERLLQFGCELRLFNSELQKEHGHSPANDKLLNVWCSGCNADRQTERQRDEQTDRQTDG